MVVALVVVAALALALVGVLVLRGDSEGTTGPDGTQLLVPAEGLDEPVRLPEVGSFVDARVQPDGSVAVTQWVRGPRAIDEIEVRALRPLQVPGDPHAVGLEVRTGQGELSLADDGVGVEPRTLALVRPTLLVRLTYVLEGVSAESPSVAGRALVDAVALDVDFAGERGPARVQVGGRRILSLACTPQRAGVRSQRTCGGTREGGWSVNLMAREYDDRVTAQVDLARRAGANPDRASAPDNS